MAFEMDTSSTGNAAKLAVLWQEHLRGDEPAAEGGGVPDEFAWQLLAGAYPSPSGNRPLAEETSLYGIGAPAVDPEDPDAPKPVLDPNAFSLHRATIGGAMLGFSKSEDRIAAMKAVSHPGAAGLSSLYDMLADVRQAIEGTWSVFDLVRKSTERTRDHLAASPYAEVPDLSRGVWAALAHAAGRLDEIEREVFWELECRRMDADWSREAAYMIRSHLGGGFDLPPDPVYPERPAPGAAS